MEKRERERDRERERERERERSREGNGDERERRQGVEEKETPDRGTESDVGKRDDKERQSRGN